MDWLSCGMSAWRVTEYLAACQGNASESASGRIESKPQILSFEMPHSQSTLPLR
jgi:hypothetical protein